jgi:PAS domain-containing protein
MKTCMKRLQSMRIMEKKPSDMRTDFRTHLWALSTTPIATVVNLSEEPVLILDEYLTVFAANEVYCHIFEQNERDIIGASLFSLEEAFDAPALKKLLQSVIFDGSFFKGFEMIFERDTKRRVMLLSGREIFIREHDTPRLLMLAMEDITEMTDIADSLIAHSRT